MTTRTGESRRSLDSTTTNIRTTMNHSQERRQA